MWPGLLVRAALAATGVMRRECRRHRRLVESASRVGIALFPGHEHKYDGKNDVNADRRDDENKFISLGKIQYRRTQDHSVREGCRVDERQKLFWVDPDNKVTEVTPQDFVLDNFVRTAEAYWTLPGIFELKLLMKGRNEAKFKDTLKLLEDGDHLTIKFATKFMPHGGNQMYKSNISQFNNFSTMTTDDVYRHEVGHAFGLADEYGQEKPDGTGKKNGCESTKYASFSPETYQMCKVGNSTPKTIYHYVAVSRYITKQEECRGDGDCTSGEYCDKGTITIGRNQCVALKADNAPCGGPHQCKGGRCNLGRCYTQDSVAMGGTCFNDDACKEVVRASFFREREEQKL